MAVESAIKLSIIAEHYALAMAELGEKHKLLDEFKSDLAVIKATLDTNRELGMFLEHPGIPATDKKDIADKIFGGHISGYVLNLLKLLVDRNRISVYSSLVRHYNKILNKKRNITVAQVITAIETDDETRQRIKNKLKNLFTQNIELEQQVDPAIIGGIIVKISGRVIDGSIKTRLENMKKQLL